MSEKIAFRTEDFMSPDGSIDIEKLRRHLEAADISLEELQEKLAERTKKAGQSLDDILVECIQSGELSESDIAEAMEMLGGAPKFVV
jgi:hypothetical protein